MSEIEHVNCRQGYELCNYHRFHRTPPVIYRHTYRTLEDAKLYADNTDHPHWIEKSYKRAVR
jgi:hypothetical protein